MNSSIGLTTAKWDYPRSADQPDMAPWVTGKDGQSTLTLNQALVEVTKAAKSLLIQGAREPVARDLTYAQDLTTALPNMCRTLEAAQIALSPKDLGSVPDQAKKARWSYVLHGFPATGATWQDVSEDNKKIYQGNYQTLQKFYDILDRLIKESTLDDLSDRRIVLRDVKQQVFDLIEVPVPNDAASSSLVAPVKELPSSPSPSADKEEQVSTSPTDEKAGGELVEENSQSIDQGSALSRQGVCAMVTLVSVLAFLALFGTMQMLSSPDA